MNHTGIKAYQAVDLLCLISVNIFCMPNSYILVTKKRN